MQSDDPRENDRDRLGIDRSTAFRRLNALEKDLGVRLFERHRDGYAPTPASEEMIEAAARVDQESVPAERIAFRASSLVALQAAARESLGVAPLPCYLGDADAGLVRMKGPVGEMAVSLWVLIHPDLRRTARVRAFVDFIVPELRRLRPLIEGRTRRRR